MTPTILKRHERFFTAARLAARLIGVAPSLLDLVTWSGAWLHPARHLSKLPPEYSRQRWRRYLKTSFFATALLYRIREFRDLVEIEWCDPDNVLETSRGSGGLILTYHHAFAYHFPAFIGSRDIPLHTLALSPEESALYPLYEDHAATWFPDTETFFNGGKWIFLYHDRPNDLRLAISGLKERKCVISLHDFPNFHKNAKTHCATLRGIPFTAPVGLIEIAVKKGLPISVGYANWLGGNRIGLTIGTLNLNGNETVSAETVLSRYFSLLDGVIRENPEFWEGWGALLPAKQISG